MPLLFFPQRVLTAASLHMGNMHSAGARRLSFQVVPPSSQTQVKDAHLATMFAVKGLYLRGCAWLQDSHELDRADSTTLGVTHMPELMLMPKRPSYDKAHPNRHQVPLYTIDGHEPIAWIWFPVTVALAGYVGGSVVAPGSAGISLVCEPFVIDSNLRF